MSEPSNMKPVAEMSLQELATEITTFLYKFEKEQGKNYYHANAFASKTHLNLVYVSYQGATRYKKAEAQHYLQWLRAGNVGKIEQALKTYEEVVYSQLETVILYGIDTNYSTKQHSLAQTKAIVCKNSYKIKETVAFLDYARLIAKDDPRVALTPQAAYEVKMAEYQQKKAKLLKEVAGVDQNMASLQTIKLEV